MYVPTATFWTRKHKVPQGDCPTNQGRGRGPAGGRGTTKCTAKSSPEELTPSHHQRKRGRERRRGGWEQKERSHGALPQEQVMEEASTGMPVQIQGEGDDAGEVE